MFIIIFIIVVILIGLSLIGLGIGMLLKKGGRFPDIHIGKNRQMKEKGISCANTTDRNDRKNYKPVQLEEEEG